MFKRIVASLFTAVLLVTGLSGGADAATAACTRDDAYVQVTYWCTGDDIDLSVLQPDANQLYVTNGTVRDWSAVRDFPALTSLIVEGASNADLAGIVNIPPTVTIVLFNGSAVTNLSSLAGLCTKSTCPHTLELTLPFVTDLGPLATINDGCAPRCIGRLSLSVDRVTDFRPLGVISNLHTLSVSAYQDLRETHLVNSTFPLPRFLGFNGSTISPALTNGIHSQHVFVNSLAARATIYVPGWIDAFSWPLDSSVTSTALADSGTKVNSQLGRTYVVARPVPRGDFSGDGKTDLLARDSTGSLWLYPGNGKGGWMARTKVGSGWNSMSSIVSPGDFNGDGKPDVLARDATGSLWLYPGNGKGAWLPRVKVGTGWNGFSFIVGPGDFNRDGNVDVMARDTAGGLWLYPGNGRGTWLPRVKVGSGWSGFSSIVGADFQGDFIADAMARDASGTLWQYPGNGKGGWLPRVRMGSGWNAMTAITGTGDLNGDGMSDVVARDSAGTLWLYKGNGSGNLQTRVKVGIGWGGMTVIV